MIILRRFSHYRVMSTLRNYSAGSDNDVIRKESSKNSPPYFLTEKQIHRLTGGSREMKRELDILLHNLYMRHLNGEDLPKHLKFSEFEKLFSDNGQEHNYLNHLLRKETKKKKEKPSFKRKSLQDYRDFRSKQIRPEPDFLSYGLYRNSLANRLSPQSVQLLNKIAGIQGYMFGQNLILDFSYTNDMNSSEVNLTAEQIMQSVTINQQHRDPFHLNFCNIVRGDAMYSRLQLINHNLFYDFPLSVSEKNHVDLFPRKKLVYLTPYSKTNLVYNPEDIYIVGALMLKEDIIPFSAEKGKQYRIRTAKLPINEYFSNKVGVFSLSLTQMMHILLSLKSNESISEIFRKHIFCPKKERMPQGPDLLDTSCFDFDRLNKLVKD